MKPEFQILLGIQAAGVLLVCAGTLAAYAALVSQTQYTSYQPVVTDMFREWPLVGSLTTGLGMTLMASGLLATVMMQSDWIDHAMHSRGSWRQLVLALVLAQVGVWAVISTSDSGHDNTVSFIHNLATLVLMLAVLYGLWFCLRVIHTLQEKDKVAGVEIGLLILVPAGMLSLVGAAVSVMVHNRVLLGISEVAFILAVGIGYGIVVYSYQKVLLRYK